MSRDLLGTEANPPVAAKAAQDTSRMVIEILAYLAGKAAANEEDLAPLLQVLDDDCQANLDDIEDFFINQNQNVHEVVERSLDNLVESCRFSAEAAGSVWRDLYGGGEPDELRETALAVLEYEPLASWVRGWTHRLLTRVQAEQLMQHPYYEILECLGDPENTDFGFLEGWRQSGLMLNECMAYVQAGVCNPEKAVRLAWHGIGAAAVEETGLAEAFESDDATLDDIRRALGW